MYLTPDQVQKKEWMQRGLHEAQKLGAMVGCDQYTEHECEEEREVVRRIALEIRGCISSIGVPELEAVLIRRYISFQPWDQIAEEMHYSLRTILRRHAQALDAIQVPDEGCH